MSSIPILILPVALCLPLALQVMAPPAAPVWIERPVRIERHVFAMGTVLTLEVEAPTREEALEASEAGLRAIEGVEARLSTWRDDTELSRLNRAPVGETFELSPALRADLERSFHWRRETAGAFDPTIGALIEAWGLRGEGRLPGPEELERAHEHSGADTLRLVPPRHAVRLAVGARIEEGGFGKGVGLDAAGEALLEAGASWARLDFGGQALILGTDSARLAVADPDERTRGVLSLDVAGASIATSGSSERGIVVAGKRLGHLLDPRTGRPATDFGSLTVLAPSATDADCLSTGLYVLGPDAALAFAANRADIEGIVLERTPNGLRARATAGLRGRLQKIDANLELEWFAPPCERSRQALPPLSSLSRSIIREGIPHSPPPRAGPSPRAHCLPRRCPGRNRR
jgi:FAD:protein FMN transferase